MTSFPIGTASKAIFGEGSRNNLADILTVPKSATILVVASASAAKRELVRDVIRSLENIATVHLWDRVSPNPRISDIDDCLDEHRDNNITHVIGIGGGSALDQAKATAMALDTSSPVADLLALKTGLPQRSNCLVLMPTTSGTGAELSYGSILTDSKSGEKLGLRGATLAADFAVVDPEMSYTVPLHDTVVTGFDVLTHAFETYISSAATPYSTDLSRGAISRVFKYLPQLAENLDNPEARRQLSYASMMMGVNLALSTTSLPHRLQYPLGAATDSAHAAGLAALYPSWLHFLLPHAEEKLAECARWVNVAEADASEAENAQKFAEAILGLLKTIKLTPTLQDLGTTQEMVDRFADEVSGKLETDPSYRDRGNLSAIYERAWAEGAQ